MPWSGSGQFSRTDGTRTGSTVWQQARDAGVKILAGHSDIHDQDLATGLEQCLNRNGENAMAANLALGGNRLINLGAGIAALDGVNVRQLQRGGLIWGGTSGGTSNAYTLSITPAPGAPEPGMMVAWIANHTSTGTGATLNLNGTGSKGLRRRSGNNLVSNEVFEGELIVTYYDGTVWRLLTTTVRSSDIIPGHIATNHLADNTVTTAKIANNAVTAPKIADGQIIASKLGGLAVQTGKLDNSAVTTVKIDAQAVTSAKLASDAVTTGKIADAAVTNGKLGGNAVRMNVVQSSTTTISGGSGAVDIDLPAHSFFPSITTAGAAVGLFSQVDTPNADSPKFRIASGHSGYDVRVRHIAAS